MASVSNTALRLSRSPVPTPPPTGEGEIDFLRQAALESRRRKAKLAADTAAQSAHASDMASVTADSTQHVNDESRRILQRKASDREEGEISSDEEAPAPASSGHIAYHGSSSSGLRTVPMAPVEDVTMRSGSPSHFESAWLSNGLSSTQPGSVYPGPSMSRIDPGSASSYNSSQTGNLPHLPTSLDFSDSRTNTLRNWTAATPQPPNHHHDFPFKLVRRAPAPSSPPRKSGALENSSALSVESSVDAGPSSVVLASSVAGPDLEAPTASSSSVPASYPAQSDLNGTEAPSTQFDEDVQEAKELIEELLGYGVPPEHFVDIEISRECLERVFPALNRPLPKNIDKAVPSSVVISKANNGKKQRTPKSKAAAGQPIPQRATHNGPSTSTAQHLPLSSPFATAGGVEPSLLPLPMQSMQPVLNPVPQYPVPDWFATPMMSPFDPSPFGTSSAYGLPLHQMQIPTPHVLPGQQSQSSASNPFFASTGFNQGGFGFQNPFMMPLAQPSVPVPGSDIPQIMPADEAREDELRRQREESARKAALASRRMKNLAEEHPLPTPSSQAEAAIVDNKFHHELDALLAEADQENQTEDVTGRPVIPSDDEDEREVEEAMMELVDDDEDELMREEPLVTPLNQRVPPVIVASPDPEVPMPTTAPVSPPVSPPKLFATQFSSASQSRSPTMPPVQRSGRRNVATDLDAQPVSRPESAPSLSRPFPPYRRSFKYQHFTPLVIEISDSEEEEETDDDKPRSPKQAAPHGSARPAPPSRTSSATPGVGGLSTEEARKLLHEKELEIKKWQDILARLEKKKKQTLPSSVGPPTSVPSISSSVASPSGISTPAGPVIAKASSEPKSPAHILTDFENSIAPVIFSDSKSEEGEVIPVEPSFESASVDVIMADDAGIRTDLGIAELLQGDAESSEEDTPIEDKLAVIADAVEADVPSESGMQVDGYITTDVTESGIDTTSKHGEGSNVAPDEEASNKVYRYWKPYTSVFDDFPLLRSHPPPVPKPTDLGHPVPMPFFNIWPLKKGLAATVARIAPDSRLCQFEASGGICRDDSCPDTHVRDWMITDSQLARHLATLYSTLAEHDIKQALGKARLAQPSAETGVIAGCALTALGIR